MKSFKRLVSMMLVITMTVGLFAAVPFEARAVYGVDYFERTWNPSEKKVTGILKSCIDFTDIRYRSSNSLSDGWYAVMTDTNISGRLSVSGAVNIIICDGVTLTLDEGIRVPEGSTLKIYGQSGDSGKLVADADSYNAAIGSNDEDDDAENGAGTIVIHGGNITANGGSDSAGIGGGNEAHCGNIIIYGGTVKSTAGTDAAGIGSGDEYDGSYHGSITIYGGNVTAKGGDCGAGIGGGDDVGNITVNILGGTVNANGGDYGAGIGGGEDAGAGDITISNATVNAYGGKNAAGIGGGEDAGSSDITISNSTVYAYSEYEGAGIGGGRKGNSGEITVTDSTVTAICGYAGGAGIGGGNKGTNGNITITGSTVTAKPDDFNKGLWRTGAGIGAGGGKSQNGVIRITNSYIYAESGHGGERGDGGGAGIGGGSGGDGRDIYITGSEVVALACGGAGIGGGDGGTGVDHPGGYGGNVSIISSKVLAVSACRGAGIGGGDCGAGGNVWIADSEVTAVGGGSDYLPTNIMKPAVTATPPEAWAYMASCIILARHCSGAGIGGGDGGNGAWVTIINSKVTAIAERNSKAMAIGRGKDGENDGKLTLGFNEKVSVGDSKKENDEYFFVVKDTVQPSARVSTCQSKNMVQLDICDHSSFEWRWDTLTQHSKYCVYCGESWLECEDHQWNENHVCTVCGATTEPTELTLIEQDDNGEVSKTVSLDLYGFYILPECENVPDGMDFAYWKKDGISYYLPGEKITVWENVTVRAVYIPVSEVEYIDEFDETQTVKARKLSDIIRTTGSYLPLVSGWYVLDCDAEIRGISLKGDVHLILADGRTLSFVYDNNIYGIQAFHNYTELNVYGQSQQSGTIDCNNLCIVELANYNQYGGVFNAFVFLTSKNCTIVNGTFNVYDNVRCGEFVVRGGKVYSAGLFNMEGKEITLGWSNRTDTFRCDHFYDNEEDLWNGEDIDHNCIFTIEDGKMLTDGTNIYTGTLNSDQIDAVKNKTLRPYLEHDYNEPEWIWSNTYTEATAVFHCKDCDDVQEVVTKSTFVEKGKYITSTASCKFNGKKYTVTETFRIIFDIIAEETEHGTVILSKTSVKFGDSVEIAVAPDDGFVLTLLYYTDPKGDRTDITDGEFIMPESDITVTAVFSAANEVEYIDENGRIRTVSAVPVTNGTTEFGNTWYYADGDVTLQDNTPLCGDVKLILCDGARLNTSLDVYDLGSRSALDGTSLSVYRAPGENEGLLDVGYIYAGTVNLIGGTVIAKRRVEAGTLNVKGSSLKTQKIAISDAINIRSGIVSACDTTGWIVRCDGNINISGGALYVYAGDDCAVICRGSVNISDGSVDVTGKFRANYDNTAVSITGGSVDVDGELSVNEASITGGNVTVKIRIYAYGDITLGWMDQSDSIYAASFDGTHNVLIEDGKRLTDSVDVYSGTYDYYGKKQLDGKTLVPYFPQKIDRVEPYIDESGAYILGTAEHYRLGGKYYKVNDDETMGEELESVELSYFDFKIINNDAEYQIDHYTGPTEELEELVIPKSYNGKKITILGNDNEEPFMSNSDVKSQFVLMLNENIAEIKPYTFYTLWVTKVAGDTSALSKIGAYAFSWANSAGNYELDITFDYDGEIENGFGAFSELNLTIHQRHATDFASYKFRCKSITTDFTDAHTYGEPGWDWENDCGGAKAVFVCTGCDWCGHEEKIDAEITKDDEEDKITYTAVAAFNGNSYSDIHTVQKINSNIIVKSAEHGVVSSDKNSAYEGEEITLYAAPEDGYNLVSITVKDSAGNDIEYSENTFIMPKSDVTVTASFGAKDYAINYSDDYDGGWISGPIYADAGEEVTVNCVTYSGYEVTGLSYRDGSGSYFTIEDDKFIMPASQIKIYASFKKVSYIISYETDGNGTVTGVGTAHFNDRVPLTITPYDGYALVNFYAEDDEWGDPANIIDNELIMPSGNVTVYAEFAEITPAREPYIDKNGEYRLGNIEYVQIGDAFFAVDNGVVGDRLYSVEVSYFDFTDNGDGWQINYYCGPTDDMTELVIPETYQGKRITVLGSDNKNAFVSRSDPKPQFALVINENINEIKGYAFYAMWVKEVRGNTSGLKKLGNYAFSWANSPGGYMIDIKLDYPGNIIVGYETFNNMTVTVHMKHSTSFSNAVLHLKSLTYDFTDSHIYGDPVWVWEYDHNAVSAIFTCIDDRCKHEETAITAVTRTVSGDKIVAVATVEFEGNTYTDVKETKMLAGHSLSLNGDIGVNYFIDPLAAGVTVDDIINGEKTLFVSFSWATVPAPYTDISQSNVIINSENYTSYISGEWFKVQCGVAAAEMSCVISAAVTVGDLTVYQNYSVRDYADVVLDEASDFSVNYIAAEGAEKYNALVDLVKSMLDYGAKAQSVFDVNTDSLANREVSYLPGDVTSSMIDDAVNNANTDTASDMRDGSSASFGLEYQYSTVIFLSKTTLRCYYKVVDPTLYGSAKETFNISPNERFLEEYNCVYFEFADIAAAELADLKSLTIGENTYYYSVLNYAKAILESEKSSQNEKALAKATYWYYMAAEAFFG